MCTWPVASSSSSLMANVCPQASAASVHSCCGSHSSSNGTSACAKSCGWYLSSHQQQLAPAAVASPTCPPPLYHACVPCTCGDVQQGMTKLRQSGARRVRFTSPDDTCMQAEDAWDACMHGLQQLPHRLWLQVTGTHATCTMISSSSQHKAANQLHHNTLSCKYMYLPQLVTHLIERPAASAG